MPRLHNWGPKLEFAPMIAYLGTKADSETALRLGTSHRQVQRWRKDGISLGVADELAIRLGTHIYMIWPEARWVEGEKRERRSAS